MPMPMPSTTALSAVPLPALLAALVACEAATSQDVVRRAVEAAAGNDRPVALLVVPPAQPADHDPEAARALRERFSNRLRALRPQKELDDAELAAILPFGDARERALSRIQTMLLSRDPEVIRLWLDTNVAVIERAEAPGFDARHPQNLILLDVRGERLDAAEVDWADEDQVARAARRLLDGYERAHDRRQDRELAQQFEQLSAPLRKHDGESAEILERIGRLAYRYPEFAPRLHAELGTATGAYRAHLARAMDLAQQAFRPPADPLPFGVTWATDDVRPAPAPCPACGMAIRITDLARRIVLDR